MIEVQDMSNTAARQFLAENHYGHLGLADGSEPYVVPINYAFHEGRIYIFTTFGLKAEILERNPNICLQVENVTDNEEWKSVIVKGSATRLTSEQESAAARDLIKKNNPRLTPALSIRWLDHWVRENIEVAYSIEPSAITGRKTRAKR